MPAPEGTFLWDELAADDVEGAKRFYSQVFGWTSSEMDMGEAGVYTMFQRAGDAQAAGLMQKPADVPGPAHWLIYLGADDVDATIEKAVRLGGTKLTGPMDIPTVGRIAVLQDPTGAAFGLFKPSET
jgi:predicted enzyme related to lactoylglutathione lyase